MTTRMLRLLAASAFGLWISAACGGSISDVDNLPHTNCSEMHDLAWDQNVGYTINHTPEGDSCPLVIQGSLNAASIVYDSYARHPDPGDNYKLEADACNFAQANQYSCTGTTSGYMTHDSQNFQWGQPPEGESGLRWQASGSLGWDVDETPEFSVFRSYHNTNGIAYAKITLHYQGEEW